MKTLVFNYLKICELRNLIGFFAGNFYRRGENNDSDNRDLKMSFPARFGGRTGTKALASSIRSKDGRFG
ncbi:hypothetical protein [Mucilaginibacter ginsenosidivorax]|uniref:Uncharacterized protein n=1 Tax=Mucilaginibacter ginsenosidivorax TaxID=862126 RepID=A0A5B8VXC0_9SPHI|nr:hypothetical protein [Mucilaginibacter ginsenosidivorax]QEC75963.1 hypothetical protein FSB76_08390 [Mucilaginibacter ginsenosidivorax]